MEKNTKFSKKLLSLFLALVMALSCFTGAFSAYAASSTDDDETYYNYLGWIESTDTQILDQILDALDDMLADLDFSGELDICELLTDYAGISIGGSATIEYDLTSVNGLFETIESIKELLEDGYCTIISSAIATVYFDTGSSALICYELELADKINLNGIYSGYASSGTTGALMTRENSTSAEMIEGLFNLFYMNTQSFLGDYDGTTLLQDIINGTFDSGEISSLLSLVASFTDYVDSDGLYETIGGLLGWDDTWSDNMVNNILVYLFQSLVADDLASDGVINTINTDTSTWYFVDDEGNAMTLEEWAFDAINVGVLQTLIGVDGEYIFLDENGDPNFELTVDMTAVDALYGAFVPVFEHTLLPLLGTISVNFNFVTKFTELYYSYVTTQDGFSAPTTETELEAYWSNSAILAWIAADYETIAEYIVSEFPDEYAAEDLADADSVEAAMEALFNRYDREEEEIDATTLFSRVLYSPVAEALGCETGSLNLQIKEYYLGKYNYSNFFDMSVLPSDGSVAENLYEFVEELLSALFPTYTLWDSSTGSTAQAITDDFISQACDLIYFVGESASSAIFEGYDSLTEDNAEEAIMPFVKALLGEISMLDQVHTEEWDKCNTVEALLYVCLTEYLAYVLPQYDYSCLVTEDENGYYEVELDDLLYMARDALAYLLYAEVPITTDGESTGGTTGADAVWSVFDEGGTENGALKDTDFTAYDMLNSIVVYYANDLEIAQLLNVIGYSTGGSGMDSAITIDNTIFENIDIIVNYAMPMLGELLGYGNGNLSSEDLIMNLIVDGVLNLDTGSSSIGGTGNQGLSSFLYALVNAVCYTDITTEDSMINVVYSFLADLVNFVFGARCAEDGYGNAVPTNTGNQPFTDLVTNAVLTGGACTPSTACGEYYSEGVLAVLVGRIAEYSLSGVLYTGTRITEDTVVPGIAYIIKALNDMFDFIPSLSAAEFAAPEFEITALSGVSDGGTYSNTVTITNESSGITEAVVTGNTEGEEGTVTTLNTYSIQITGIECLTDSGITGSISGTTIIDQGEEADISLTGTLTTSNISLLFEVTYDIVDASGNLIDEAFEGLTAQFTSYVYDDVSWFEEFYVYDDDDGEYQISSDYVTSSTTVQYFSDGTPACVATSKFGSSNFISSASLYVCYPLTIILESTDASYFDYISFRAGNTSSFYSRAMDATFVYYSSDSSGYEVIVAWDEYGDIYGASGEILYTYSQIEELGFVEDESGYDFEFTYYYGDDYSTDSSAGDVSLITTYVPTGDADTAQAFTSTFLGGTPIEGLAVYFNHDDDAQNLTLSTSSTQYIRFFQVLDGYSEFEPGTYDINLCFYSSSGSGEGESTIYMVDTSDRDDLEEEQEEVQNWINAYSSSDLATLSSEDTALYSKLGYTSSDATYYDLVMAAIATADSALNIQMNTTNVVVNDLDSTSTKETVYVTESTYSTYGDEAYVQVSSDTVVDSSITTYAKDGYLYLDSEYMVPLLSNTPVTATASIVADSDYVVLDADGNVVTTSTFSSSEASDYTVYYANEAEYEYEWNLTAYDYPYYEKTTTLSGTYAQVQYSYMLADGSSSNSKQSWEYKYPQTTTQIKENDSANDYRSVWQQVIDLLDYVYYIASQNIQASGVDDVVNDVLNVRTNLNENNFYKIGYKLMVKHGQAAESLISEIYETTFVEITEDSEDDETTDYDEEFSNATTYDFYYNDTLIDSTTYSGFLTNLYDGDYSDYGLTASSVTTLAELGVTFGYDYTEGTGEYESSASGIELAMSVLNFQIYAAEVYNRGYENNNYAVLDEALCATGADASYNFATDALYDTYALDEYVKGTFANTTITYETTTDEDGNEVTEVASASVVSDGTITAKYGAYASDGTLENTGDVVYTDESWENFVEALAALLDAINSAVEDDGVATAAATTTTTLGYSDGAYDYDGDYTVQVTDLNTLRSNLVVAENELEEAEASDTVTVSGQFYNAIDPSDLTVRGSYLAVSLSIDIIDSSGTTTGRVTSDEEGNFELELAANSVYSIYIYSSYGVARTATINTGTTDIDAGYITYILCDYAQDGSASVADASAMSGYIETMNTDFGDLNGDGAVNVSDQAIVSDFVSVGFDAILDEYNSLVIE